jgi:hypothetical protein
MAPRFEIFLIQILWDICTKTPLRTFVGHGGPVQTLALLKPVHIHNQAIDARYILTGSNGNVLG